MEGAGTAPRATRAMGDREAASAAAAADDFAGIRFLAASDLSHNDVLLGRGGRKKDFAGNINFRNVVVAPRKAEYIRSTSRQKKLQIAREVVDYLRLLDPPGRFVRAITSEEEKELARREGEVRGILYAVVEDNVAMEKARMTLRQKESNPVQRPKKTDIFKSAKPGSYRQHPPQNDKDFVIDLGLLDLEYSGGSLDDADSLIESASSDVSIPDVKQEPAVSEGAYRLTILTMVRSALNTATDARLLYGDQSSAKKRRQYLSLLGQSLRRQFLGGEPDPDQAAKTSIGDCFEPKVTAEKAFHIDSRNRKRQANPEQNEFVPLGEMGLPLSLSLLVKGLLDAQNDTACLRYDSLHQVEADLRLMNEQPKRYLFDVSSNGNIYRDPSKLYGRKVELQRLEKVFERAAGSPSGREVVFISGLSGAGKTALVEHMSAHHAPTNCRFIRGKFEEMGHIQPLSIVHAAFDGYCNDVAEEGGTVAEQVRDAMRIGLGERANILTGILPNISRLINVTSTSSDAPAGQAAYNQFSTLFKLFVNAISQISQPIVLFFDDVQWADEAALDLLASLLSSEQIGCFLAVYCYREDELSPNHPLQLQIKEYSRSKISVTEISMTPFDVQSTSEMVADMLRLPPGLTRPLASISHSKTGGNVFFIIQFIQSLADDGLLSYSKSQRHWEWDLDGIQSKDMFEDVVDLLRKAMMKTSDSVQNVLKIAACLGQGLDGVVLKLLGLDGAIDVVVEKGFMYRHSGAYRFVHDKIQEASYALLLDNERERLHHFLGRSLWNNASFAELESILFVVAEQFHRGSSFVVEDTERIDVAKLCLAAGEKADATLAFLPASIYYLYGCGFLNENDWDQQYDLCHRLFSLSCKAQFLTGSYKVIPSLLEPVLSRSKCLKDRVDPMCTLISAYVAEGKHEALDVGIAFLAQLGEELAIEPTQQYVMGQFMRTRAMFKCISLGSILQMPVLRNEKKIAAMKVIALLLPFVYAKHPTLAASMIFRMVQLSVMEGVCEETGYAVAAFGVMCLMFGTIDAEVYGYTKIAHALLDRSDSKNHRLVQVYTLTALIKTFFEPIQAIPDFLERAYDVGIAGGDNEYAFVCKHLASFISPFLGGKLDLAADKCRKHLLLMAEYKRGITWSTKIVLQATLNLLGHSDNPTELEGECISNQEDLAKSIVENHLHGVTQNYFFIRMWLAYLFRRDDLAAQMATRCRTFRLKPEILVDTTFYVGLIAVRRVNGKRQGEPDDIDWRSIALESKEKLKNLAQLCPWNFAHKDRLLGAEIAYKLEEDLELAALAYDQAISLAGEHRFLHEEALACELAGLFHAEEVRPALAADYLERARKHYGEWGALAKVDDLERQRD